MTYVESVIYTAESRALPTRADWTNPERNRERKREIKVKEKTIIEARTQVHGKEKTDTRKHTKIKDQLK